MSAWKRVVFSDECDEMGYCPLCHIEYAECACPGPTQDGITYREIDGVLHGMKTLRVLVACEFSATVRDAFIARGHEAMSCDLLPCAKPGPHYQGDVRDVLGRGWDLMIAHPPCTYLCSSGLHWNKRGIMVNGRPRAELTEEAIAFVQTLLDAPIEQIALENPIGCISSRIRKPDQVIQPHQFGHDASKSTCLWLKNLLPLKPTLTIPPRMVDGKSRWANQTDSGQNKLGPSADRWALRSLTYQGIADAMASQWGLGSINPITNYELRLRILSRPA